MDLTAVSNGTYTIYETEEADGTGYVSTGVSVEVKDAAKSAVVNYYTVTFHNEDAVFEKQIVLNNAKVNPTAAIPKKEGYIFSGWVTTKDGSTAFDFKSPITSKTDIYASFSKEGETLFTITALAGAGGSISPSGDVKVKSGDNQKFTITPQKGYRISSVLVDGSEVLTRGGQTADYAKAGIVDAADNIKYYEFDNVTRNHTLSAYFKAAAPGRKAPEDSDNDGADDNGGPSGSDANTGTHTDTNSGSDKSVIYAASTVSVGSNVQTSHESEPKTGDFSHMEIYATVVMIAGLSYILIYFSDGKSGMTEEEKKEIVTALVKWAKKGRRVRRYVALTVIFWFWFTITVSANVQCQTGKKYMRNKRTNICVGKEMNNYCKKGRNGHT